jgi:signal transduction histidine kinase/CheY-like chemotaxis protein
MGRTSDMNLRIRRALVLGFTALAINSLCATPLTRWGDIAVYLAAVSFGPLGAVLAVGAGVVPQTLYTGNHLEGARILMLALSIAYAARYRRLLPSFIVTAIFWSIALLPLWIFSGSLSLRFFQTDLHLLILRALFDVGLVLIVEVILLNKTISCAVHGAPRTATLQSILVYTFSVTSSFVTLGALGLYLYLQQTAPHHGEGIELVGLMAIALLLLIGIPTLSAERITTFIVKNFQEICSASSLLSHATQTTFSGMASAHWRRFSQKTVLQNQNSDAHQEFIATESGTGMIAFDPDGLILSASPNLPTLLQIEDTTFAGKHVNEIGLPPPFSEQLHALITQTLSRGAQAAEITLNTLPKSLRFFEIATSIVHAPEKRSGRTPTWNSFKDNQQIVLNLRETTEKRVLETHLLKAQKLGSLGSMVHSITQEFQSTLTTIQKEATEATQTNVLSPSTSAHLQKIIEKTQALAPLITQILDYARQGNSVFHNCAISQIVRERLDLLRAIAGDRCSLTLECQEDNLFASCDPGLLIQAISNLIINAAESYGENGGGLITIAIDAENIDEIVSSLHIGARPGNFIRITIRDSGCGMTREALAKAFEPLFTTKSHQGHSGLGLSIVHSIAHAHHGFLTAESHPAKGTTICLYIPLASRAASQESVWPQLHQSMLAPIPNIPHVLVIEDEETVRELVGAMLETIGYRVTTFPTADIALEWVHSAGEPYDLVLTDFTMPGKDGLELVNLISARASSVPTIIMTGHGALEVPAKTTILRKPFDITQLENALQKALADSSSFVSGEQGTQERRT